MKSNVTLTHSQIFKIYNEKKTHNNPCLGLVRIFENGILNTDQTEDGWLTNMTVAKGREFAAQTIFKKHNPASTLGNVQDFKVDSFGVGSGGSEIDSDNNVALLGPNICDLDLYKPIEINTNCLASPRLNKPYVVKKIEQPGAGGLTGSITMEISTTSEYSSCATSYTIVKNVCIIDASEPKGLDTGESVRIDEAMLFATAPSPSTSVIPFAHICFAPKFIELETIFTIEWYVIF